MTKLLDYYAKEWPKVLGSVIGTTWLFVLMYYAASIIHG